VSKKKMTAGERIAEWLDSEGIQWEDYGETAIVDKESLARRIDAAISREVKKVLLAKPSDRPNPYEMARPRSRKP
jgi:hypothetical protein